MTQIPILFSTPMVQAILDGRKTMTRRKVKGDYQIYEKVSKHITSNTFDFHFQNGAGQVVESPYGKPGDVLWVRETWTKCNDKYYFKSDGVDTTLDGLIPWKPSIYMPKSACRIWLEVMSVKVERLQEITEQDAIKEGIEILEGDSNYKNYLNGNGLDYFYVKSAKLSFKSLWQSINGKDSWELNPWVWVVEFKRIEKP